MTRHGPCGHGRHGEWRRRKERVLHTRVSDRLAEDIRRIAEDLRVPASNLVRNVLEEVFDVVESMSDDMGDLFEEVLDEAEGVRERLARSRGRRHRRRRRGPADRGARAAARAEVEEAERGADTGAPPPPPVEWHVVEGGAARGPYRFESLRAAASEGRLGRDTLVWCAGMPDWATAGEVAALADLFAPPPLPDAGAS